MLVKKLFGNDLVGRSVKYLIKCPYYKLFGREIIFQVFQPMWSRYLSVTDGQTDRRTDNILWH